jgi:hypothetical protein
MAAQLAALLLDRFGLGNRLNQLNHADALRQASGKYRNPS